MAAGLKRLFAAAGWRRRLAWCAVLLAVVWLHGWISNRLAEDWLGWGAANKGPQRMEVAFVRELKPTAAPVVVRKPVAPKPKRRVARPQPAASAPEPVVVPAPIVQEPLPAEPLAAASEPEVPASSAAVASAEPAASQPTNVAYEWPPSSRLSYAITGNYKGPVEGSARVLWIRVGSRYQVQMDTRVALVATRRSTSDGELTDQGLRPRRYDEETEVLLGTPRRVTVLFEDQHIVLNNGRSVPRPEGVQDTASQLVQLVWLFTMQPERLRPGSSVELPIALPWRVDTWVFDVLEPEVVQTPFGEVAAVHVKPRRPARPGNVLTVECWFAPGLQYLPARIRIEQNPETWLDLVLERPPLQAAEP